MKHYFIAENEIQTGPFTIEEILSKKITRSTLIWSEGYEEWQEAIKIEELKNIVIAEPPPIPKKVIKIVNTEIEKIQESEIKKISEASSIISEYDNSYTKETEFTFFGVGLFIATVIINNVVKFSEQEQSTIVALYLSSLVIRVLVLINIKKIAVRQNRDSNGWAIFGFLFPTLALIIIGQLKKLNLNISSNDLQSTQNLNILFKNAKALYNAQKYSESIIILNKIIEINNQNYEYLKLRVHALFNNEEFKKAKNDLEKLVANQKYLDFAYNYLGEISIIHGNKDLAISYWQHGKELYSTEAIINLNRYYTYEKQYILNSSQTQQKTKKFLNFQSTYFLNGKYIQGLDEIDKLDNPQKLSTKIFAHDIGVSIELATVFKTIYNIAISYYEIENIIYNESVKIFELHLHDKKVLKFNYDIEADDNNGLQQLQQTFYSLIRKKTDFSVYKK